MPARGEHSPPHPGQELWKQKKDLGWEGCHKGADDPLSREAEIHQVGLTPADRGGQGEWDQAGWTPMPEPGNKSPFSQC